jgi:tetratricopeptide (TPR) repeat protein
MDSAYYYYRKAKVLYNNDREVNRELIQMAPAFKDYDVAFKAIAAMINTGDNEKIYWPQLAELYYMDNQYHKAAGYYQKLIEDDSGNAYYYLSLAGVLSMGRKPDESNKVLLTALDRFGPRPEFYTNVAVNYANQAKFKEAEKYFRLSLGLSQDNIPTWINLANVLSALPDRDKKLEALEIYKTYKDQTPAFYNLDSVIAGLQTELGVE